MACIHCITLFYATEEKINERARVLDELYRSGRMGNLLLKLSGGRGRSSCVRPEERFMIDWTISTINKRRFINYIQRASYENRLLTSQELVKLIKMF